MLSFASDENFNNDIVRGLLRRKPDLDIVRVQDVGLSNIDDPTILEWAAREERILLTHDITTMAHYAYERVKAGKPMPGVIKVADDLPIGQAVEDILLLAELSREKEWEGIVIYLPLD
jgi:predicted nuclease of predicted toxin-antitoxin system